MDIITHTLSGMAAATVVACFAHKGFKYKLPTVALGAAGGALPDLDAVSLWSGFDKTVGKLFALPQSGKTIYSAKLWYSHHGFFHSVAAALLLALLVGILIYWIKRPQKAGSVRPHATAIAPLMGAFLLGYIFHLLEDMPTPGSTWGGVRLLFPSNTYYGGYGKIWWWNNYDIFLVVLATLLINSVLLFIFQTRIVLLRYLTSLVFAMAVLVVVVQVNSRQVDFAYSDHTPNYQQYELKSKEVQKQLLGDALFHVMERFDKLVRVNF